MFLSDAHFRQHLWSMVDGVTSYHYYYLFFCVKDLINITKRYWETASAWCHVSRCKVLYGNLGRFRRRTCSSIKRTPSWVLWWKTVLTVKLLTLHDVHMQVGTLVELPVTLIRWYCNLFCFSVCRCRLVVRHTKKCIFFWRPTSSFRGFFVEISFCEWLS